MRKLDRVMMTLELVVGFSSLIIGIIQDSWIIGWCSGVCITVGLFISVWAELEELWKTVVKMNDSHMEFLEGLIKVCKEASEGKSEQSNEEDLSGSSPDSADVL